MFSTQRMSYFLLYGILFLPFTSCHLFESTKVPKQNIITASSWSPQDIGPSFGACDGLDQEAMENCFETTITSSLQDYLNSQLPEANVQFEETVTITLKVDGSVPAGVSGPTGENGPYSLPSQSVGGLTPPGSAAAAANDTLGVASAAEPSVVSVLFKSCSI